MSVILDSRFATAEDTAAAAALGVSDSRFKRLMRVAGPKTIARRVAGPKTITVDFCARAGHKAGTNGKFKLKSASRKKQTRGKTKKAAH